MIIIERYHEEPNPCGGRLLPKTKIKVFEDDDIEGVQSFLDEKATVSGYEWRNVKFNYIKL